MEKDLVCTTCGGRSFTQRKVLWPALVEGWGLSTEEEALIERQQGLLCDRCQTNLRSNALAVAIQAVTGHSGRFRFFPLRRPWVKVLEVNEAGSLHTVLRSHPRHTLAEFPDVDFQSLPYPDGTFDLVIHSDTLEHIPDPALALKESRRVLKPGGWTCFTVPALFGRLTKSTVGDPATYHGSEHADRGRIDSLRVHTEFGADFWTALVEAGFREVRLFPLDYPAAVSIAGRK